MKKIAKTLLIVAFFVISILLPFLLMRVFSVLMSTADQQALAAWCQTVGVIVALIVIVSVSRGHALKLNDSISRKTDSIQRKAADDLAKIACLVDVAYVRSQKIKDAVQKKSPVDNLNQVYDRLTMESLKMALNQIPVYKLGTGALIESFLTISDQTSFLTIDCETYKNGFFADDSIKTQRDACFYNEAELANMRTIWETAMNSNIATRCRIIKKNYETLTAAFNESR